MKTDLSGLGIEIEKEQELMESARKWHAYLRSDREDYLGHEYTGWVKLPENFDRSLLDEIKATAEEIREKCTLFIVIGIGGSFLGAKAVIDALNKNREGYPEVVFAGFNMSAAYMERLVKRVATESVCVCVISKSGRTVEPLLTYSILKDKMFAKYGYREARRRIYVITDAKKGDLCPDAFENQFKTFVIPDDVGGRYSVLTPVGLLPIACAGHDIDALLQGAADMARDPGWEDGRLLEYSVCRIALQRQGKKLEIFEYFENNLRYFGEWLKQLFGETEGKEGKGAYPACLSFSRDLHSIGQFLQQGSQIFYETMITLKNFRRDFEIPWYAGYPYAGKTLEQINNCAEQGVILAHKKGGIPISTFEIEEADEYNMGQLIYFFEMSAAISAYNLGLNPFDQPGVENYKHEMMKLVEELE
ncbi:MAG: glucose-6-phosphate isomerase [Anaerovoracaceae bacterium]